MLEGLARPQWNTRSGSKCLFHCRKRPAQYLLSVKITQTPRKTFRTDTLTDNFDRRMWSNSKLFFCRRKTLDRIRKSEVGEHRDRGLEWTLDTHLLTTDNNEPVLLTLPNNFLMQFITVLLITGVVCYPDFHFCGWGGGHGCSSAHWRWNGRD